MVYCNFWCWRCSLFSNIFSNIKTNEIDKRSQTLKLFFSSCFSINKKGDKVHNQTNCLILYVSLDGNHKHYIGIVRHSNIHYNNTVCKLVHDRFSIHIHIYNLATSGGICVYDKHTLSPPYRQGSIVFKGGGGRLIQIILTSKKIQIQIYL